MKYKLFVPGNMCKDIRMSGICDLQVVIKENSKSFFKNTLVKMCEVEFVNIPLLLQ